MSEILSWDGCHVCHSPSYTVLREVEGGAPGAEWRSCTSCATVYQDKVPAERIYLYGHTCEDRVNDPAYQRTAQAVSTWVGGVKGKRVLEVGCGTGWLSVLLSQLGAEVHALELPQNPLSHLTSLVAKTHSVNIESTPEYLVPYRAFFDVVINWEILEHVRYPDYHWFEKMSELLAPNGVLLARYCDYPTAVAAYVNPKPGEWRYPSLPGLLSEIPSTLKVLNTTSRTILAQKV